MIKIIDEKITHHRTIAGTEWPVIDQVQRQQIPGQRPEWVVVRGLCNGTAEGAETYPTKKAAREAL